MCLAEALTALLAVARQRIFDDRQGMLGGSDRIDLDGLALEPLNPGRSAAAWRADVLRHLVGLRVGVEFRDSSSDSDNLVVLLAGVDHGYQADGADESGRHDRLLTKNQHIKRVVVLGQGLRNEAIVRRERRNRARDRA